MAWTSPRTWYAGETVTAALMNAHIRDDLNILKTEITDDGQLMDVVKILHVDTTQVSRANQSGDLQTWSLPAGTMEVDDQVLRVECFGYFDGGGVGSVAFYFGSSYLSITAFSGWTGRWHATAWIFRVDENNQFLHLLTNLQYSNANYVVQIPAFASPTEDLTGAVTIKCYANYTSGAVTQYQYAMTVEQLRVSA